MLAGPVSPVPLVQPTSLAFTVTDTHLIFGTESGVEQAVRTLSIGGASSLTSAEWFTKAKSAVPSAAGLACLEDVAASTEFLWDTIKQSGKNTSAGGDLVLSQTVLDIMDFSLLPPFESVRKYFGLWVFYGSSRPDGFFFEFKHLDRQESK